MSKAVLALTTALLLVACNPALAGWWHRHHCCYATPVYYAAPAAAPQQAPSDRLLDALLPVLTDILRGRGQLPNPSQPQPNVSTVSGLEGIKSDIAQLAASVENTNSTLRRHGEEIATLRLDLTAMQSDVTAVKGDVALIKGLVGSEGLRKDLKEVLDKLPRQTKEELLKRLTANDFFTPINAQTALNDEQKKLLIAELTKLVNQILDTHYGTTSP